MLDDSWATRSAIDLTAAIRSREITSRGLLELYLDRIQRLNPSINAIVTLDVDRARAAADAADARTGSAAPLPPLHGLPITIKDAIETEGIRSTGGAVELTDHVPAHDAPAVARLREAGAIVFGKTNLPRWSGDMQTYNEIFGTTNNPWDHERIPGGSSGGAAAAVAAGLSAFDIGTDLGGSVRLPSHCCGTFGLKPSYGIVPQRGYLDSVGGGVTDVDINVFGPIARSAADLDLVLSVLAGPEPARAPAWQLELPPSTITSLAGVRIATWLDDPLNPGERAMLAVLQDAVDAAADAGAIVSAIRPPVDPSLQSTVFREKMSGAIAPSVGAMADTLSGTHAAWQRTDRQRAALQDAWAEWFVDFDVLLTPVMCSTAFPHLQEGHPGSRQVVVDGTTRPYVQTTFWTGMFGVIGVPVVAAPVGRTPAGLPVGMQVVAPFLHDRQVIAVAGLLAAAAPGGGYRIPPDC